MRLYEADLIQNDSKQNGRSRDTEKLRDKFEKQEASIENLSKKVIKAFLQAENLTLNITS